MDGDAMIVKEKPMVIDKHTKTQSVLGHLYTITNISSSSFVYSDGDEKVAAHVPTAPCESKM